LHTSHLAAQINLSAFELHLIICSLSDAAQPPRNVSRETFSLDNSPLTRFRKISLENRNLITNEVQWRVEKNPRVSPRRALKIP
jgi:hypothetical protein